MKRGFRPKTTTSCRWMCEERDYSISGARRPPRPFCCLRDYDEFTNRHPPPPQPPGGTGSCLSAAQSPRTKRRCECQSVDRCPHGHSGFGGSGQGAQPLRIPRYPDPKNDVCGMAPCSQNVQLRLVTESCRRFRNSSRVPGTHLMLCRLPELICLCLQSFCL